MKYKLTISISCSSSCSAEIIVNSLSPELKQKMPKAYVKLRINESDIILIISSEELSTVRAAANSYLRWIETAQKVHHLI